MSATDLVGRFRMFENQPITSAESNLMNYLHEYSDRPFIKDELTERLKQMEMKGHKMRVRRMGKDSNDIFWHFGKIHGLENIALIPDEKLEETCCDPVELQKLVNTVEVEPGQEKSNEEIYGKLNEAMVNYKNVVNNIGLVSSDRKRILSLPIYMSKRSQNPEPLRGQKEFDMFTSLTGKDFTSDASVTLDKEHKITEYDFEKYLNP